MFGTKRELREQRILQRGDVLKSNDFNKDYFTRIDLRVTRTIRLYSKSAKLMTSHPASSYSLDKDAQGQYTLRITNPQAFWSVSKYLVITVNKPAQTARFPTQLLFAIVPALCANYAELCDNKGVV